MCSSVVRVPLVHVDAVHHAVQPVHALRQHSLKALAPERRDDLARVPLGNRQHAVGGGDGALQDVHHQAEVELVRAHVLGELVLQAPVPVPGHTQVAERDVRLHALVQDVVNRGDGPRVGVVP